MASPLMEREDLCRTASFRCRLGPDDIADAYAAITAVWRDELVRGGRIAIDGIGTLLAVPRGGRQVWDGATRSMRDLPPGMGFKFHAFLGLRRDVNRGSCDAQ